MKAPIKIPGRLDYKRRMQIQISGQKQEQQMEFHSRARDPQISVPNQGLAEGIISEIKDLKTPVFENRLKKEASGQISGDSQRCCWQPVKRYRFCRVMPALWREHIK